MTTWAIANLKGGTGKTTTAVSLSGALARLWQDTLLVDLDPQGGATFALGGDPEQRPSMADVLLEGTSLADVIRETGTPDLWLAGASIEMAEADVRRVPTGRLKEALDPVRDRFKATFLDCPPSLSLLTLAGIEAADLVIVPVVPEPLVISGLVGLFDAFDRTGARVRETLIVLVHVDRRRRATGEVMEVIRGHYGSRVAETVIPVDAKLVEAPSHGMDIHGYANGSPGAVAYRALLDEILGRMK